MEPVDLKCAVVLDAEIVYLDLLLARKKTAANKPVGSLPLLRQPKTIRR